MSMKFIPDGSAEVVAGVGTNVVVRSDDSSPQQHTLELTPATSGVRIIN